MRVLGVVTARGGSKRVPGKNIADLGGKPLIAWSIEVGLATCAEVVTTTDSVMIADVAMEHGSQVVMRPESLAHGEPGMQMKSILMALNDMTALHGEFDAVLLLQPTSPFREAKDVLACVEMLERWSGVDSVVSVVPFPDRSAVFTIGSAGQLKDVVDGGPNSLGYAYFTNTQQLYRPNGAVFLARTKHLLSGGDWFGERAYSYIMPASRSVDIDTHRDLDAARSMLSMIEKEFA